MKILRLHFLFLFFLSLISCKQNVPQQDTDNGYVMPPEVAALPTGTTLGLRAPGIKLPDLAGEEQALSELRGKLVLVDFWASWCNPCRMENPVLVEVYNKFNNQRFHKGNGFEIFSVSLDRNEKAWRNAVNEDGLVWPYQLSDLAGAKSQAAVDYGIQMIPSNFLLDQHGVIIATNLRGEALEQKLEELLVSE